MCPVMALQHKSATQEKMIVAVQHGKKTITHIYAAATIKH